MTIKTTLAQIQDTNLTIGNVKRAPHKRPGALKDEWLPLTWTRPGPTTGRGWHEQAVGMPRQDRIYIVTALIAPLVQGEPLQTAFDDAVALLQAFGDHYLDDTDLGGTVDQVTAIADGGIVHNMLWASKYYTGFEFRFTVVEK